MRSKVTSLLRSRTRAWAWHCQDRALPFARDGVASVGCLAMAGLPAVKGTHAYHSAPSTGAAAQAERVAEPSVPLTRTDAYGAISVVEEENVDFVPTKYENIDGRRIDDGRYTAFADEISAFIPKSRQYTDPVRTFAYGTDASFYRLNPKMVIKVHSEEEIRRLLPVAKKHGVPVTFRAAGTSLSGQALTDSVLLKISHVGKNFRSFKVHGDGSSITLQPGLIGGEVNRILAAYKQKGGHPIQYKIGPDPSSIDSCMIGGILNNNSSGMCCGVSQNTYNTLKDIRLVLADGTVLDTGDEASRAAFLESHADLVKGLQALVKRVQSDRLLVSLIRRKFAIKCTTGYSLNALVDFPVDDPIEIIKRLMVGSEGTLSFVSQATYNTASAFLMFPTIEAACVAAAVLRRETAVDAVELFDRPSIREFECNEAVAKLTPDILGADGGAAALLVECRGQTHDALHARIREIQCALKRAELPFGAKADAPMQVTDYEFWEDPAKYNVYWDVRKGLIPIVGGAREPGTTMLLEDVACPVDNLAAMTRDLIDMFQRWGYDDAYTFGHALEGNLHLVFSQGFRTPEEVQRFSDLMDEMCDIVANKHSGSLKGEHGTGRNMAPYVEMEWGTKATELMWELKALFDPDNILNPGVILNKDPHIHLKNLKPSPPVNPLVNHCIECGFCESNCPSRDLTLTPRQRIAVWKEIFRLENLELLTDEQTHRLKEMKTIYEYDGKDTCAADGMCKEKCPVKINTGALIKEIRAHEMQDEHPRYDAVAGVLARRFGSLAWTMRQVLGLADVAHGVLGPSFLQSVTGLLNRWSGRLVPEWNPYMPKRAANVDMSPAQPEQLVTDRGIPRKVVYLPACVTRIMGPARGDDQQDSVHEKMLSLFNKADYEVVYPEGFSGSCCGMMFNTRGFNHVADGLANDLEESLVKASEGGKYPIVVDTSPCLANIKGHLKNKDLRFALYEPVEFISTFLTDKLEWEQVREKVAIHVPCSSKQMGVSSHFAKVASKCAGSVVDSNIPCCGMAGDRGMRLPELTGSSLQHLGVDGCSDGYSTSRTCEIALSKQAGFNFRGLVYLVDEATRPKARSSSDTAAGGR
ncbi:Glycolate oxidase subunit GlcD [Auxenochlorella protothecoides]|uniref:D-lactate dehydrogenase (cytochrome) n=1 Tax=Auxenochlorella protothecoides TaxID=3075 RepID=A0A087SKK6_AUXPR|nr:Glycolate oxidase subunit GlcD [Auxenochlorella protothecoides]KFM26260.1 Glycolate oxidase subunit GlcD [Auxenochlorella protothecoides]RMZ56705.1 hypothetical protein APUTEX25_002794 [Auxenochlorella protothecoides]|eukprot:RMZ56705.1 hypothetical protein APUTEX25_002794 [Auxenochlorella protothecoides]